MKFERSSGILMHPTSLPGDHGIGDLGNSAYRFVDFLAETKQKLWQVLPLGPTGYGDSPYQCFSTFAGNPLLISLDKLCEEGLLSKQDITPQFPFDENKVDYGNVITFKNNLYKKAFDVFVENKEFKSFCTRHAVWLDDYALFYVAEGLLCRPFVEPVGQGRKAEKTRRHGKIYERTR